MHNVKLLSVFTDASYCNVTGAGGYAFVVHFSNGRPVIRISGQIEYDPGSSQNAEVESVRAAIQYMAENIENIKVNAIQINIDCIGAIKHVQSGVYIETRILLRKLHDALQWDSIQIQHVAAHKSNKRGGRRFNRWCDNESRARMRERREILALQEC